MTACLFACWMALYHYLCCDRIGELDKTYRMKNLIQHMAEQDLEATGTEAEKEQWEKRLKIVEVRISVLHMMHLRSTVRRQYRAN